MPRTSRPPDGWITLHQVAVANELTHYHRLILRLCRDPLPRLAIRRSRGARCVRATDLEELGRRLDRWRRDRHWTRRSWAGGSTDGGGIATGPGSPSPADAPPPEPLAP